MYTYRSVRSCKMSNDDSQQQNEDYILTPSDVLKKWQIAQDERPPSDEDVLSPGDIKRARQRALALSALKSKRGPASILFVCDDGVSRSIVAESIMKRMLREEDQRGVNVMSAGTDVARNSQPDPKIVRECQLRGLDVSFYRAEQLDHKLIDLNDIVLAMDGNVRRSILVFVADSFGEDFSAYENKIITLRSFLPNDSARRTREYLGDEEQKDDIRHLQFARSQHELDEIFSILDDSCRAVLRAIQEEDPT